MLNNINFKIINFVFIITFTIFSIFGFYEGYIEFTNQGYRISNSDLLNGGISLIGFIIACSIIVALLAYFMGKKIKLIKILMAGILLAIDSLGAFILQFEKSFWIFMWIIIACYCTLVIFKLYTWKKGQLNKL